MMMPSYTTLPESMLSPSQITDKFNVPTMGGLRGLGACGDCLEYDDSGNCVSIDSTGCDTSSSVELSMRAIARMVAPTRIAIRRRHRRGRLRLVPPGHHRLERHLPR